ncbi:beta-2-microglobulin [Ahaetulla prasina]|uniref:beta-2-microglobulin n=1 Tax=Ahaetulla prasina TaxID=499056 RepID=UPI00264887E5|nr:beta-2-microglobulin [Ahaetulla prasina]XP_058012051.1 beta-2-microglobulin [Ahaetulla prasina]
MASKELLLWCVVLVWVSGLTEALEKPPTVQVYSRYPITIGKENILHCFAESFHPPKINVTLLKNNAEIPNVKQSDLSFKEDWTFQLLTHVAVVPNGKDEYSCTVSHQALKEPMTVKWEQDY